MLAHISAYFVRQFIYEPPHEKRVTLASGVNFEILLGCDSLIITEYDVKNRTENMHPKKICIFPSGLSFLLDRIG